MRVAQILLLLVISIFVSCKKDKPGKNGILSYDEMKKVVWDMTIADEYVTVYIKRDSTKNITAESNKIYQKVFALHHTDSAHFFNSFNFYRKHPEYYKILLDSLSAYSTRERENRFFRNKVKIQDTNP